MLSLNRPSHTVDCVLSSVVLLQDVMVSLNWPSHTVDCVLLCYCRMSCYHSISHLHTVDLLCCMIAGCHVISHLLCSVV